MKKLRKSLSIGICLSLLVWGGFFACTNAQYIPSFHPIEKIYEISNPLQHVFLLLQRINPLLQKSFSQHSAADEEVFISIPHETIIKFLDESKTFDEFFHTMRISIIQSLIHLQYPKFIAQPYQDGNNAITLHSWDFHVLKNIETKDMLDTLLTNKLSLFRWDFTQIKKLSKHLEFSSITITTQEYQNLWPIFLFKTEQDLRDLWYELISWKTRANVDKDYRRYNIMTAFKNIGNVRLIMPGEIFNLAREIRYTPSNGNADYVFGYATFGAGARMVYGGWLCGVATALYQGSLTNLGFQLLEYSAHSTYYRNLFNAEINGTRVSTPGLDATIYTPIYNLQLKNIRDYPIVTIFNFGWAESDPEQMFTLSMAQDKGSFEFVWSRGMCFTWKINGQLRTNCYEYVKNF